MDIDTTTPSQKCELCGDDVSATATYPDGMSIRPCKEPLCYSMALDYEITQRSSDKSALAKLNQSLRFHAGDIDEDLDSLPIPPTECSLSKEEFMKVKESLEDRGAEVITTFRYWHGLLGVSAGGFGKMKVDALMIPASPMFVHLKSKAMADIVERVGHGLADISSGMVGFHQKGEKCPIGTALLTRFTEEKLEHQDEPPIEARHCIHLSMPNYSDTSLENKAKILSKDVDVRKAI